jgi:hypothetical protein
MKIIDHTETLFNRLHAAGVISNEHFDVAAEIICNCLLEFQSGIHNDFEKQQEKLNKTIDAQLHLNTWGVLK